VTSSSLEVLAGLALSTQEYVDLMIFKNGQPSPFYRSYVRDVQDKIVENAAAEFQCIWREHSRLQGSKPRTMISDELSSRLNSLQTELESSDLFDDVPSRKGVMKRAIPKTLVDQVGLDTLLSRLPESYLRALFSSWVASHFVGFLRKLVCSVLMSFGRYTSMASMALVSTFSISLGIWLIDGEESY
jgi:glutamate dehydrogenase